MKKFTLLELLIVVAIIAILVSILIPSLYNARTKAIMAVCQSNISQNIKANLLYATANDRFFMDRVAAQSVAWGAPYVVYNDWKNGLEDDRKYFKDMGLVDIGCPFTSGIDNRDNFDDTFPRYHRIEYSYSVYFGWKASDNTHLTRLNKPLTFNGIETNVVVTDIMQSMPGRGWKRFSHNGGEVTRSRPWFNFNLGIEKKQDLNYGLIDGSVSTMYSADALNDSRLRKLPYELNAAGKVNSEHLLIPNQDNE